MISSQFARFAFTGVIGFLVDAGFLMLLKGPLGYFGGRACSFFLAVSVTWIFNRYLTFHNFKSEKSLFREYLHYFSLAMTGGLVNYFVYTIFIINFLSCRTYPFLAVAAGSMAGMLCNYAALKYVLFVHKK